MADKPMRISEEAAVQMPMKTVASLITLVALGTWAFFGIQENLNRMNTELEIFEKDLNMNTEFRIKWPRGQAGSLPQDQEQFMMIEDLYRTTDRLNKQVETMMNNRVNIEFLQKQMDKVLSDIEKLKDANREIHYKNGNATNQ
tara:strand:+ start:196 stop:624 length:429 start_codon:yes stop_codon:yes gene_type:complete